MDFALNSQVTLIGGVALTQEPALWQGTLVPISVLLHLSSMKLQVRSGTPTGKFHTVCVLWLTIVTWEITRWWHSRLKLVGSQKEKTELLLFPNSKTTGLYHVHSTWAGTFILAALVAVFSGLNFVLLDSDCLPVTLFEDPTWLGFRSDPKVQIQHRVSST